MKVWSKDTRAGREEQEQGNVVMFLPQRRTVSTVYAVHAQVFRGKCTDV